MKVVMDITPKIQDLKQLVIDFDFVMGDEEEHRDNSELPMVDERIITFINSKINFLREILKKFDNNEYGDYDDFLSALLYIAKDLNAVSQTHTPQTDLLFDFDFFERKLKELEFVIDCLEQPQHLCLVKPSKKNKKIKSESKKK